MRGSLIFLTYKIKNFFQKISERRNYKKQVKECKECGNCDECSMTGICVHEVIKARYNNEINIED